MRDARGSTAIALDLPSSRAYEVRLLNGFELRCDGTVVDTAPSCQRVLAFVALKPRTLPRAYVAASLWPDTTDGKACANLRTALWRLNEPEHHVLLTDGPNMALRAEVWVDTRYLDAAASAHRTTGAVPGPEFVDLVRGELLPGHWDSWLVFERERVRQETINLYEVLCRDALSRCEFHVAVLAALAAVECDPLRESSNACLITAHLAEGNRADAMRAFRRYHDLLDHELGVSPTRDLGALIA